jgi:hypothetical protein
MASSKPNCWDVNGCGRGPDSDRPCPAAVEDRLDGAHGGLNGGRACWVVDGTPCGPPESKDKPCNFAQKYMNCRSCKFYKQVMLEEIPNFILFPTLLERLKTH